jgi:hypothetical protein
VKHFKEAARALDCVGACGNNKTLIPFTLWQTTTELRVMVAQYDGGGSLEAAQWIRVVDEYHRQPIELNPHELGYIPIAVPGLADGGGGGGVPRVVRHAYLITHIYGVDKGCPALASIVLDGLPMKQPILYLVVVVGRVKGKDRGMSVRNDVTVTQPGRHRGAGITLIFPSPATCCAGGGQPVHTHTGGHARDLAAGPSPWYGDTTPPHDMDGHFHGRYIFLASLRAGARGTHHLMNAMVLKLRAHANPQPVSRAFAPGLPHWARYGTKSRQANSPGAEPRHCTYMHTLHKCLSLH